MDLLIGWQPYETTFRGESVRMELRPLLNDQYRMVLPYMRKYDDKEEAANMVLEMIGKTLPIFQGHVQNIRGLTINGTPPTPEMMCGEAVLARLAQDIVQELFIRSSITEAEEKNSGSPSEALSSDDHPLSVSEA